MHTTARWDPDAPADNALTGIVLSNLFALLVVGLTDGGLLILLWPYWLQSVVIGFYARRRILALQRFSTEGFRINDRAVDPTPETARRTANFFALHYGGFHAGYLVFLLVFTFTAADTGIVPVQTERGTRELVVGTIDLLDLVWMAMIGVGFVSSHRASHREHVEADLRGTPKIGTLMALPYARIIPMHLTIIFGAMASGGAGLLLFGGLKTLADVLMHKVEHRLLQRTVGITTA
jgi:hypothetical protein